MGEARLGARACIVSAHAGREVLRRRPSPALARRKLRRTKASQASVASLCSRVSSVTYPWRS